MRNIILQILTAAALTMGSILASAMGARASDIVVIDAFARASATPRASSGVVYLSISNNGSDEDRIVSVSTPLASSAMLHQTVDENGVMKMNHVDNLAVPAGSSLKLAPGGTHIMLMGLKEPLKEGESMPLTVTFAKAGKIELSARIGSVAATAPGN
jgi:hypothetical protein